ncbi:MAG: hypothetical protein Q7K42_00075, partial [Candidatus Diapherotrites archaeon]|nr:hypothetical protein [Candidatus Diapherotrites archaeon]
EIIVDSLNDPTIGPISATVDKLECSPYGNPYVFMGNQSRDVFVTANGTASGPIGANFGIRGIDSIKTTMDCGAWTQNKYMACVRDEGQPEAMNWNYTSIRSWTQGFDYESEMEVVISGYVAKNDFKNIKVEKKGNIC